MKIAVGCDHAGLVLLEEIRNRLRSMGHELLDFGTHGPESVDYTDFAHKVADAVSRGEAQYGVLCCGTGLGMSYAANRHLGIRAALCTDAFTAKMARLHNDANVLCLGGRVIGLGVALDILDIFFNTDFEGGRHARRVAKIEKE